MLSSHHQPLIGGSGGDWGIHSEPSDALFWHTRQARNKDQKLPRDRPTYTAMHKHTEELRNTQEERLAARPELSVYVG